MGLGPGSQFEEFLVIGVSALRQGDAAARLHHAGDGPAECDTGCLAPRIQCPFLQRISQYAHQLGCACSIDHNFGLTGSNCRLQRQHTVVVKYQPVQPDIGVEHQAQRHAGQPDFAGAGLSDFQVDVA